MGGREGREPAARGPALSACPVCGGEARGTAWRGAAGRVARCAGCGHRFLDPVPPEGHLGALYDEAYFARFYRPHADARRAHLRRRILPLLGPPAAGARLLDVGCGAGDLLDVASEAGWTAVGVDVAPAAVAEARGRGRDARVGPPEAAGSGFDVAVLLDVLAHVPRPVALLRAVRDVLAPGGRLLVKTPHRNAGAFAAARLLTAAGAGNGLLSVPAQVHHFTPASLADAVGTAGFVPVRTGRVPEHRLPARGARAGAYRLAMSALEAVGAYRSIVLEAERA